MGLLSVLQASEAPQIHAARGSCQSCNTAKPLAFMQHKSSLPLMVEVSHRTCSSAERAMADDHHDGGSACSDKWSM